jgi:hypothetical protein
VASANWRASAAICLLVVSTFAAAGAHAAPSSTVAAANFCPTTKGKSKVGKTHAQITFVNQTGETLSVYWLNYSGQRVFYKTLLAGKRYTQQTYLTHPWLVLDPNGKCVASLTTRVRRLTYVIRLP